MSEPIDSVAKKTVKRKPLPSKEYLEECFEYRPETGELLWKVRPAHHFKNKNSWGSFNTQFAGTVAGNQGWRKDGRKKDIRVGIGDGRGLYSDHLLIFVMMGVDVPDGMMIDHKNRNPFDNRWDNLRLANEPQNGWNRGASRTKKSGLPLGVYFRKNCGRFTASININKKMVHLGYFETVELAIEARRVASAYYYGEFTPKEGGGD